MIINQVFFPSLSILQILVIMYTLNNTHNEFESNFHHEILSPQELLETKYN